MEQSFNRDDFQSSEYLDNSSAREASSEVNKEQYIILESNTSTGSSRCNQIISFFSAHNPQSFTSVFYSGSQPTATSSISWNNNEFETEKELLGPGSNEFDRRISITATVVNAYGHVLGNVPHMDLRQALIACAETLSEDDNTPLSTRKHAVLVVESIMNYMVDKEMVSVYGDPFQRLGAYVLEGIRARLFSSGSILDNMLKCKEPTAPPRIMSYMNWLHKIYPYHRFAHLCAYYIIGEVLITGENSIHIVDFQIAQGVQWEAIIKLCANQRGGPPVIRITGVDDCYSAQTRGGGLYSVGQRLLNIATSCGVTFQFNALDIQASEVKEEDLSLIPGQALVVNFPYVMHQIPDESVSDDNHRDHILHLVKKLPDPKILILVEQELNTNTGTFLNRFRETLDYYSAIFECIDASALNRNDELRIGAEEHCLGKEIVNMISCEGIERVERHEVFSKWASRLRSANFSQMGAFPSVKAAVTKTLKEEFSEHYTMRETDGTLYIGWKNKALASCSCWK